MTPDEIKDAALHWLLNKPEMPPPFECCDCPFSRVDPNSEPPNYADPGEGNYLCDLLGEAEVSRRNNNARCWTYRLPTVWGENPKCTLKDWQAAARGEPITVEASDA